MDNQQTSPTPQSTPPVEPTSPPQPIPVESGSRKRLIFAILAVFLLLALGAGVYVFAIASKPKAPELAQVVPTAQPTPTTDPTADWSTLNNTVGNFSIKYPSNLIAKGDYQVDKPESDSLVYLLYKGQESPYDNASLQIHIFDKNISAVHKNKTLEQVAKASFDKNKNHKNTVIVEGLKETMFAGKPAFTYVLEGNAYDGAGVGIVTRQGKLHVVETENGEKFITAFYTEDALLAQVLSTFTFTDSDQAVDTANWKTYTADNVIFKYPSNWNIAKSTGGVISVNPGDPNKEIFTIVPRSDKKLLELKKEFEAEQFGNYETTEQVQLGVANGTEYFGCFGVEGCMPGYVIIAGTSDTAYNISFNTHPNITGVDENEAFKIHSALIKSLKFTK